MTEDLVRQLGYLCLGTRLKRLGERLQSEALRFTEASGLAVQPGQYPMLAAIDRDGPLTIGELVEAIGISQPGITRAVARLAELGLVEIAQVHRDKRHKTVSLTTEGSDILARAKRELWPHIEAAVTELCSGLSGSLLEQIGTIEDDLAQVSLDRRIDDCKKSAQVAR